MPIMSTSSTILIVDDHEMIRELLARSLENQHHRIITASSGTEALTLLQRQPIDLVLLDVMMPGMNGVDVLKQMKSDRNLRQTPVIVISADTDTDRVVSCITLGADDYISKPFNMVFVRARVNACLERNRLREREAAYQRQLEDRVAERTALAEQRATALERSEAELRRQSVILESILNSMSDGVVVVDNNGDLLHHNPAARQILNSRLPELLPSARQSSNPFRDINGVPCPPESLPLARALIEQDIAAKEVHISHTGDDRQQWLHITASPLRDPLGPTIGGVAVVRDISATKHAELALRESEARYALAARGANDGLWDWNLTAHTVYYSPRWRAMLGYAEDEIGDGLDEWLSRVHPDDREGLEARLAAHYQRLVSHFEHEYRMLHKDGTYRWMLCRGLAIWDDSGRATRMAGSQTDITDRKKAEQQLLHDALHDGLTGLPNRALLIDRLSHAINRSRRHPTYQFALLFLDLDRFKVINDSLGHTIGDQLLITIAHRLESCLRPGDTIARLGGDEFVVLLEETEHVEQAQGIAERVQQMLSAPLQIEDQAIFTTVSIGILMSDPTYCSAAQMIRDADTAMYQAKMRGKACAIVFDPAMHAQAIQQLQIESDLRGALERNEFRVFYQPIVELDNGHIVGFEALLRWQHPQRGLLTPGEFLTIAEETGLIVPISWWVLRTACAQIHQWHSTLPGATSLWVSVNLSPKQLAQPNMLAQLLAILNETGLDAQHLKLEITEHTLIEYGELTIELLSDLRRLGVQLCIDDFGTGYSSLSYLQRFPVDVLKIDRSFISQIDEHNKRGEIVRTIIALARNLGLRAVAEGTETMRQAHELRRLACDFGQGWLFAKALDADKTTALILTNRSFMDAPAALPDVVLPDRILPPVICQVSSPAP